MIAAVCIWGMYSVCSKWATKQRHRLWRRFTLVFSALFYYCHLTLEASLLQISTLLYNITFIYRTHFHSSLYGILECWRTKIRATTSGIFLNFNPIFTAILAFLFLGEELTWIQILGTMIVVTGCYLFSHFKTVAVQPTRALMRKHS